MVPMKMMMMRHYDGWCHNDYDDSCDNDDDYDANKIPSVPLCPSF
jgi:hypothetical protein